MIKSLQNTKNQDTPNITVTIICIIFIIIHIALVLKSFPIEHALNNNFLSSDDLKFHFASAVEGNNFYKEKVTLWGYSPNYMAGYPFGLWGSMSRRGYEITSRTFPFLSFPLAYYFSPFLLAFLTPLLMATSFKLLGFNWQKTALCTILSIILFQFDSSFYWQRGSIMFPFCSALSMIYTSLLHIGCKKQKWLYCILAGIIVGFIAWLHQLLALVIVICSPIILLINYKNVFKKMNWLAPLSTFLIGGLIISPWVLVLLQYTDLRMPVTTDVYQAGMKHLIMDVFSDRKYIFNFDRRSLTHVIFVLAFSGWLAKDVKKKSGVLVFFSTAIVLFICTYTFSYSKFLRQLEPYHYLQSSLMFMIIPATVGFLKLQELFKTSNKSGKIISLSIAIMLLPSLTGYILDLPNIKPIQGLNKSQVQTINYLKSQEIFGRILCQDEVLCAAIQYETGKELIGGSLSSWALMPHRWSNVTKNKIFGHPIKSVTNNQLDNYLDLFNIQYVVTLTEELTEKFSNLKTISTKVATFDTLTIFKINKNRISWIYKDNSSVKINAYANHIIIDKPPHGKFIIKYHYFKTLTSNQKVTISPILLLDDPVPFIQITNSTDLNKIEIYHQPK